MKHLALCGALAALLAALLAEAAGQRPQPLPARLAAGS